MNLHPPLLRRRDFRTVQAVSVSPVGSRGRGRPRDSRRDSRRYLKLSLAGRGRGPIRLRSGQVRASLPERYTRSITTVCNTTSLFGLSWRPRGTLTIFSTISRPSTTSPKIV